ncbi:MAG: nucleotidyltransferase domain-containing protein [Nitrospirae bacterium]|nr:nucleotidyltransferase domain-containing protein [Nitrospirota bacterium]
MQGNDTAKSVIRRIVDRIGKEYRPERIILFGSYAYGEPDRDSDIDLLIIKSTPDRPIDRRVKVRQIVSDPQRLIPFEPLVLTPKELKRRLDIGDQFIQEILNKGEVLYAA